MPLKVTVDGFIISNGIITVSSLYIVTPSGANIFNVKGFVPPPDDDSPIGTVTVTVSEAVTVNDKLLSDSF